MPAATNPTNYAPFFWELLQAFPTAVDVMKFAVPTQSAAKKLQGQYHSFIRALERDAEKKRKAGDIAFAKDREREANLGRTRKVVVTQENGQWYLIFMLRNADPIIQRMMQQMHLQFPDRHDAPKPLTEKTMNPEGWKPTDIPDFFKPSEGEGYNVEIAEQGDAAERQAGNQSDGEKASKN